MRRQQIELTAFNETCEAAASIKPGAERSPIPDVNLLRAYALTDARWLVE